MLEANATVFAHSLVLWKLACMLISKRAYLVLIKWEFIQVTVLKLYLMALRELRYLYLQVHSDTHEIRFYSEWQQ